MPESSPLILVVNTNEEEILINKDLISIVKPLKSRDVKTCFDNIIGGAYEALMEKTPLSAIFIQGIGIQCVFKKTVKEAQELLASGQTDLMTLCVVKEDLKNAIPKQENDTVAKSTPEKPKGVFQRLSNR